jgi:hypothetical protein
MERAPVEPEVKGDVMEQVEAIDSLGTFITTDQTPAQVAITSQVSSDSKPEDKISLTLADLKSLVLGAVQEAVAPFAEANVKLQEKIAAVSKLEYAEGVPGRLQRHDTNFVPSRMDVAMSATIATRPVIENPEQYQHVVDPTGLSVNNASPMSPKAVAECFEEPNGTR